MARNWFDFGITTAKTRKSARTFALNQCTQPRVDQGGPSLHPGKLLGFREKSVVYIHGRAHIVEFQSESAFLTSFNAHCHAWRSPPHHHDE